MNSIEKTSTDLEISSRQEEILTGISRSSQLPHAQVERAKILLTLSTGESNLRVAQEIGCHPNTVSKWKMRWINHYPRVSQMEGSLSDQEYKEQIHSFLSDAPRAGRPPTFTAEQMCQLMAIACQPPEAFPQGASHMVIL